MLRLSRVVPLALLGLALPSLGYAEVGGEGAVELEAPVSPLTPEVVPCPGTLDLEARLRTVLEESACGVPERQLLVTLRHAELASGTLVVLHDYQAEFVREVSGPSCAEVESALTLALEIYLDPGETGQSACAPKAPPVPASGVPPSAWPGQDLDPFNLPQAEPAPLPSVIEPQPSGLVRALVLIDSSYSPNVAFGVGATVRLRLTPQNFASITLSHQIAPPFVAGQNDSVVHVSASAVGLGLGQYLPIGTKGEFSFEAGPRIGVLETGTGTADHWELAGTIAVELTVGLGMRIARGLWGGVEGGLAFNLLRARYLDEAQIKAWEQPWTGGYFALYVSAAVPGVPRAPRPAPPAAPAR